jgi:hypothetical protein
MMGHWQKQTELWVEPDELRRTNSEGTRGRAYNFHIFAELDYLTYG